MKPGDAGMEDQPAAGELAVVADLRLRLQGSQQEERAARAEARRLARELALAHRLLRLSAGGSAPIRSARPAAGTVGRAVSLDEPVIYHLDHCQRQGPHTLIAGWAFRPAPGWDARATAVTLLFRRGGTTYYSHTHAVIRPDVAAHYATQPAAAAGGALGLEGAGFACEIVTGSLPAGAEWTLVLRLECGALAAEQSTGHRLRG